MDSPLDLIFNQWTFFLAPLLSTICSARLLRHKPPLINFFASLLFFLSAAAFFMVGGLSYFLRDGLGPDSVTSTGSEAISRFMEDFPAIATLAALPLAAGFAVCKIVSKTVEPTRGHNETK